MILALDLAQRMGWAMGQKGNFESGMVDMRHPSKHRGGFQNYHLFDTWCQNIFAENKITEIVSERVHHSVNVAADRILYGLEGILAVYVYMGEPIPWTKVPATTLKKFWCGSGKASKDDMLLKCFEKGFSPVDDNEADAIALLHYEGPSEEIQKG